MASDPLDGATPVANDPLAGATPLADDPLKGSTPAKPVPSPGIMGYPTPDGKVALIPTRDESGRALSDQDAIAQYKKTGKHIGVFNTPQDATAAAQFWQSQSEDAGAKPIVPDESAMRSMFLGEAARQKAPLAGTYAINPAVSAATTPEQMRAAGIKVPTQGPAQAFMQTAPVGEGDSLVTRYGKAIFNAIPEEINSTYSGLSGLVSAAAQHLGIEDLSKEAQKQAQASAEQTTDEGMTGGQEAVNFLAKVPLMITRMGAETAAGVPPWVGESLLEGGAKYAQAKASGATENQALAASGISTAGNAVLFGLGGKQAEGMSVPKEIAVRGLKAIGLGSLANLVDAGATATYAPEEARKQLTSPEAYAKGIAQFGALETLGAVHSRFGARESVPETPEPRTHEQAMADADAAMAKGDLKSARQFELEAQSLKPTARTAFREATPEEAARAGKYEPLTAGAITPEVEQAAQEAMRPGGGATVTEPAKPVTAEQLSPEDATRLADLHQQRLDNETALDAASKGRSKAARAEVDQLSQNQSVIENEIAKIQLGMKEPERGPSLPVVESTEYQGQRQGSLMGPNDEQLVARDPETGKDIGRLWVTKTDNGFEVRKVETDPEFRGRGVATKLYKEAADKYGPYAGSTDQTPEGKALVDSLRRTNPEIFGEQPTGELTPGISGTETLSNEEIQRQQRGDTYYRIDRTGRVTNLGPQPDAPVRKGEAIIMISGRTGEPQVQNSQGLGSDSAVLSRFGNKVMQVHEQGRGMTGNLYSGLDIPKTLRDTAEAAKRELGLPEGATDADLGREVMSRIGKLGSTVKETVVRIMSKIKGIGRDMAQALAEHFHQALSGTKEGQLGAIGKEVKAYTPEEEAHYQTESQAMRDMISRRYPGEENAAKRAELYKKIPTKSQMVSELRGNAPDPVQESTKPIVNRIYESTKAKLANNEGATGKAYKMLDDAISGLNPAGVSDKALIAATELQHAIGKRNTAELRTREMFGQISKTVDEMPEDQKLQLIHALETPGRLEGNNPVTVAINKLKDVNAQMGDELARRGIISGPLSDYMHRVWENNEAFQEYQRFIKNSLSGSKGYTKQRVLDMTVKDAMEKFPGLKLKDTNPFRVAMDDLANKQKMLTAQDALKNMSDNAIVQWHPSDKVPRGMVPISDGLFTETHNIDGKQTKGHYYTTPDVARVLNNYINPGFEQFPKFKNVYDGFRAIENAQASMQLGLSMFHGTFVTNDIVANKLNVGLQRLIQDHDLVGFGKSVSEMLGSPVDAIKTAEQAKGAVLGNLPPELQKQWEPIIDGLERGGMRFTPEHENMIGAAEKLSQAAAKMRAKYGDQVGGMAAVAKNPVLATLAAVEMASKPLMEYYVPMAKVGVFTDEYREFLRRNPTATDTQKSIAARNISKRIEDRLGQVSYENMNWNKFLRQILFLGVRATGWDVGSLKVALGPQGDVAKALAQGVSKATGGRLLQYQVPTEEGGAHPWLTNRMTYLVASSMLAAMVSQITRTVTHAIHPDVPLMPDSIKDVFYPRVGGKDASGRDKRVAVPGYMGKEIPEIWHIENESARGNLSPAFSYLWGKVHPTPKTLYSLISGKDWQGNDIYERSTEPFLSAQHVKDVAGNAVRVGKYLGKEMTPYSISNALGGKPGYDTWADTARQFMGFVQPKASMLDTPAESYLSERRGAAMKGGATPDQVEQRNTMRELTTKFANGDTKSAMDAVKNGLISPKQMDKIAKDAGKLTSQSHIDRLLTNASFDDMYNASNLSDDPVEMEKIINAMGNKLSKPDVNMTPQKAIEAQAKFQRAKKRFEAMK